ncbi:MAG: sensory box histidine kinase/response regulator, partial [Gemmatimonadetes bacterium]|nr:sensory box histidine kinase/response regulator [Gemmatimonadota bacterium]
AQRLSIAAQRIASMLFESTGVLRVQFRTLASDSAVVAALEHADERATRAARELLAKPRPGTTETPTRALWTMDCRLVLAVGPLSASSIVGQCPVATGSDSAVLRDAVLPLQTQGDSIVVFAEAPVIGSGRDTVGYLVETRISTGSGAQAAGALIGKGAAVMIGNATGPDVWTDLSTRVTGPRRPVQRDVAVIYTPAGGEPQIGMATGIPTTPWLVWVQMPLATAVAGQYQTLSKLALIALLCIVVGVAGAWTLSNHVTRPLVELTSATTDIAEGNYSRRVVSARRDELGTLMSSFNSMAARIEASDLSHTALTQELEERFRQMQDLAHALELSNKELSEAAEETLGAHRDREVAQLLLDEVLAQAPVGIGVFDEELRFVRVNATLASMNGTSMSVHVGQRASEMAETGCVDEVQLGRVLATGETLAEQRSSSGADGGSKRHWLTNYFPVRGTQGEVTGVGVVVLDTTANSELEAQLLQALKMEAVGRLAGGVAHDFNNLLTVISSYSQMALETLRPGEPLYADMQEIRTSADRASRLTRQLLAFSRKQVMQTQVLDLNHVATEMEVMLRRLIGEEVTFVLHLDRELGEVTADPGQIEQVLMNLVLNARDAMPDGGHLEVTTANVTVSAEGAADSASFPSGNYVTLRVSDTGVGMDEHTKTHLFDPFFTTKEVGKGTGLGLSTVYGIVKQSGGEILVQSSSGHGSTFEVYLPRTETRRQRTVARRSGENSPLEGSETILVVEDDSALRQLALRVLRAAGYMVLEARSASAAIELGRTYPDDIHLLLTDVVMPQANGRIVSERLQTLRPNLRVLFMSGYTRDVVIERGAHSELLEKSFTPEQLKRRVRDMLDAQVPEYRLGTPGTANRYTPS